MGATGFTIAGGQTMSFSANSGYTLNVVEPVSGSGTLAGGATPGSTVNISSRAFNMLVAPAGGDLNFPNSAGHGPVRAAKRRQRDLLRRL